MSPKLLLLSLAALVLLSLRAEAQGELTRFRDKNRLLLVFAPSAADPRWQKQDRLLAGSRAEFREREIRRFDLFERGRDARHLRERYTIKAGTFRVLLIGKDARVASSQSSPMTLREITGQIDRMPMRRDEMRRRKENR